MIKALWIEFGTPWDGCWICLRILCWSTKDMTIHCEIKPATETRTFSNVDARICSFFPLNPNWFQFIGFILWVKIIFNNYFEFSAEKNNQGNFAPQLFPNEFLWNSEWKFLILFPSGPVDFMFDFCSNQKCNQERNSTRKEIKGKRTTSRKKLFHCKTVVVFVFPFSLFLFLSA